MAWLAFSFTASRSGKELLNPGSIYYIRMLAQRFKRSLQHSISRRPAPTRMAMSNRGSSAPQQIANAVFGYSEARIANGSSQTTLIIRTPTETLL
jgi:hypothetical protein